MEIWLKGVIAWLRAAACRVLRPQLPPEPIVVKQIFHPKQGTWEGTKQLLNQLAAFAL